MVTRRELTLAALLPVTDFLNKCYPCGCDKNQSSHPDDECPGEIYEAEEVIRIVLDSIDIAAIWSEGYEAGYVGSHRGNPYADKENR